MELIQNSVYNREGKKWKQRWAILKKISPKSRQATNQDAFYYLFLYKDSVHAKEGKEKHVLPLVDFCGLDSCKQYDKAYNVLVLVTTSQTMFLSFENPQLRDQWIRILVAHFGEASTYDISIPDKQKLKAGQATIRLYQSFFSIITSKNFRCLNRWYTNDILHHSAEGESQFMFEIGPPNKNKGLIVHLSVPNNAEEISKAFAEYESGDQSMIRRDFHGSSLLDELGQAKRNAGDNNFIRRAILRASDRMRKKIRDRSRSTPGINTKRPVHSSSAMDNSMSVELKYRSLDRKTSPDIGIQLSESSRAQTLNILKNVSPTSGNPPTLVSRQISIDEPAPMLPKKRSPNPSSSSQQQPLLEKKIRSMTTSDIPFISTDTVSTSRKKPGPSRSEEQIGSKLPNDNILYTNVTYVSKKEEMKRQKIDLTPTDKSEIVQIQPRRSVDSVINNNHKQPANPAKYAISKTRRPSSKIKGENQKTPTPPPRSPVSLGLAAQQPNVFDFPPTNEMVEDTPDGEEKKTTTGNERKSSLLSEIDKEVNKRRTVNSEDLSDDAFTYSSEPSPANSYYSHNEIFQRNEPAYGNIDAIRKDSSDDSGTSNNLAVIDLRRYRPGSKKHLSDPLVLEAWAAATGDGKAVTSIHDFPVDRLDYVNVKGTQQNDDSDHDSYVNVSTSGTGKPELGKPLGKLKKNIPEPLILNRQALKSYRNEFEKYDDDDTSIYHAVGALDNDSSSSTGCISAYRKAGGSYENMNLKTHSANSKHSDYLNLMSPAPSKTNSSRLNYVIIGSTMPGHFHSKSVSTSPIRSVARSPIETHNESDYTRIDQGRTEALNRSMIEHRQQASKQQAGNKTPTKTLK